MGLKPGCKDGVEAIAASFLSSSPSTSSSSRLIWLDVDFHRLSGEQRERSLFADSTIKTVLKRKITKTVRSVGCTIIFNS